MFENAIFLGSRFGLPVLAWFPDLQHRALQHLFSRSGWLRREAGFRLQAATRSVLVLSSEAARADCERFYPTARGSTAVVRFAAPVDVAATFATASQARERLGVPEHFLFLPNQFFAHKNHSLIVDALELAASRGQLRDLLPIVSTGSPVDPRNPQHFRHFKSRIESAGLGAQFRHIGLIDYQDVLALAATTQALVNPSLFEGWSTPIEEAKALGTTMILSDLPVLREQAPDAAFFDPHDPAAFLELALEASSRPPRPAPDIAYLSRTQEERSRAHADALLDAVMGAMANAERSATHPADARS